MARLKRTRLVVMRRAEGLKANGRLKKGFKFAKGGRVVKARKSR